MGNRFFVALNISTSKATLLVASPSANGIKIIESASAKSTGIYKGDVIDINQTVNSIKNCIEQIKRKRDDLPIDNIILGLTGSHIKTYNTHAQLAIMKEKITEEDVITAINHATAIAVSSKSGEEILHVLPQENYVDGRFCTDAIGMKGEKLEVNVHIITCSSDIKENISRVAEGSGLTIEHLVFSGLAAAESTLTPLEKAEGSILIDIGTHTTNVSAFKNNFTVFNAVVPIGGAHVSNDIAKALQINQNEANDIKVKHGCCMPSLVKDNQIIKFSQSASDDDYEEIPRNLLAQVIQCRYNDIFEYIQNILPERESSSVLQNISTVVMSGGGSQMEGCKQLARDVFDRAVRIGSPEDLTGLSEPFENPESAIIVGLIKHAYENEIGVNYEGNHQINEGGNILTSIKNIFKKFI